MVYQPAIDMMKAVFPDQKESFYYRLEASMLFNWFRRVPNPKISYEDFVSDVIVRFLELKQKFESGRLTPRDLYPYLNQTISNKAGTLYARRPKHIPHTFTDFYKGDKEIKIPAPDNNPLSLASQHELSDLVRIAIDSLPEEKRAALRLREIEGLNLKEISSVTRTRIETVKSRLSRARKEIREKILI